MSWNVANRSLAIAEYMQAMRAESIPAGWRHLWFVEKMNLKTESVGERNGHIAIVRPGIYTYLRRLTDATLYSDQPGEVVMEDTPFELRTHLGFVMRARGRVLVTGLGLGCVVRGLLANPAVESVTCIENSPDVLALVAPYMFDMDKDGRRLEIIEADALEWTAKSKERFDCAWHDLWTNEEDGEPHLDVWHARILTNLRNTVRRQGAWSFDRACRRMLTQHGLHWIG